MAWVLLPVNYKDATWNGLKRYELVNNEDGTVSFQDVTEYTNKESSFFGAKDANRMNEALNAIMSMVENGTDLYTAFQNYFTIQKVEFEDAANLTQDEFERYVAGLKADGDAIIEELETGYQREIDDFEDTQEAQFNAWFKQIKDSLGENAAGNLQNQINDLEVKTDGFVSKDTVFSADGKSITETYGNKRIETKFLTDSIIEQKLFENNVLLKTKTITFTGDGRSIMEVVS